MAKQIVFGEEARKFPRAGGDKVANAVRPTLGPSGRNVILDKRWGEPLICSDGVTIAKEIDLPDPFENMGAQLLKEASAKTNDVAGDGTTTSAVLAQAIIHEAFKRVAAGSNPMEMKSGIDKAVTALKAEIKRLSTPVTGRDQITQVAMLSAHEQEIGNTISDVMEKVGKDGVVTVEESKGMGLEVEYVEGLQFDRGFISAYFITNPERMEAILEDVAVIITDKKLSSAQDIVPALEKIIPMNKNIFIIADDVEGEALAMLVVNKLRGTINALAVRPPGFGDHRKENLEDMALLTGGRVMSEELGNKLDKITEDDIGHARKIISDKDKTTIIEGAGTDQLLEGRIREIKAQIEKAGTQFDKEQAQQRLAKLVGGVAIIKVGGATEIEVKERKARVEDALAATRAAVEEGIVPGGGTTLLAISAIIDKLPLKGDEMVGAQILKKALEEPIRLLCENSGATGSIVINTIRASKKKNWGFNMETKDYCDMIASGIIDPAKVTRTALENAASIATMVLTVESLISDIPAPPELLFQPPAGGMGMDDGMGGMGGMGGMDMMGGMGGMGGMGMGGMGGMGGMM